MDPAVALAPDERGFVELDDGGDGGVSGGGASGGGGKVTEEASAAKPRLAWWRFRPSAAGATDPPPRILIIWGAMATARHADDVAAWLRDAAGCDVLLFDHRGVGASLPAGAAPQSAASLAADACALVDAVWGRGAGVHVFGASMGGMAAQELACLLAPAGRLRSLTLCVCRDRKSVV